MTEEPVAVPAAAPGSPDCRPESGALLRQAREIHGQVYNEDVSSTERLVISLSDAMDDSGSADRPSDP